MWLALACLPVVMAKVSWPPWPPEWKWKPLATGLHAWEGLGFDKGFNLEVQQDSSIFGRQRCLFAYPKNCTSKETEGNGTVRVVITGTRTGNFDRLRRIVVPIVDSIMAGNYPTSTSVNRHDLIQAGGGLTLFELGEVAGQTVNMTAPGWGPLLEGLKLWVGLGWDTDFAFNVGNTKGNLLTVHYGKVNMTSRLPGASLSKWPAGAMIAGLVSDGTMKFEDKASKYLKWWTTDPNDNRANVTLRDLMTFTSGYESDGDVKCADDPKFDYVECARLLYLNQSHTRHKPGTHFAYIGCHLQFAGAMAAAATGLRPDQLFEKYLYKPIGMTGTTWGSPPYYNPNMAAGIVTTGHDFQLMLQKMLDYSFLGREVLGMMERDWNAPPKVYPCGDGWFGHYTMAHWFECTGYGAGTKLGDGAPLPERCLREAIQGGPGMYGYWPLIDRHRGYYSQIVLAEDPVCKSEIPEYLRILTKPVVDAIIEKRPLEHKAIVQADGGITLLELADIFSVLPPNCNPPPHGSYDPQHPDRSLPSRQHPLEMLV